MPPALPTLEELQEEWKQIYQKSLPSAARTKSRSQPVWPVHNDHCFARIILDSTVGISSPWTSKLKSPAYKNMTIEQLQDSIELAEQILIGEVDLVELNERSLELRGKGKKGEGWTAKRSGMVVKPERRVVVLDDDDEEDSGDDLAVKPAKRHKVKVEEELTTKDSDDEPLVKNRKTKRRDRLEKNTNLDKENEEELPVQPIKRRKIKTENQMADMKLHSNDLPAPKPLNNLKNPREPPVGERLEDYEIPIPTQQEDKPSSRDSTSKRSSQDPKTIDLTPYLKKIALSSKTPFQKRVLSLLCQVPPGQYTTYGAISKHLNSSPRAVGNAIRNNPFAPHVPCHRILATGGGIGGFHGSWGRNGEPGLNDDKKRQFLRDEGVRFDGKGKVVGKVWEGFK